MSSLLPLPLTVPRVRARVPLSLSMARRVRGCHRQGQRGEEDRAPHARQERRKGCACNALRVALIACAARGSPSSNSASCCMHAPPELSCLLGSQPRWPLSDSHLLLCVMSPLCPCSLCQAGLWQARGSQGRRQGRRRQSARAHRAARLVPSFFAGLLAPSSLRDCHPSLFASLRRFVAPA